MFSSVPSYAASLPLPVLFQLHFHLTSRWSKTKQSGSVNATANSCPRNFPRHLLNSALDSHVCKVGRGKYQQSKSLSQFSWNKMVLQADVFDFIRCCFWMFWDAPISSPINMKNYINSVFSSQTVSTLWDKCKTSRKHSFNSVLLDFIGQHLFRILVIIYKWNLLLIFLSLAILVTGVVITWFQ